MRSAIAFSAGLLAMFSLPGLVLWAFLSIGFIGGASLSIAFVPAPVLVVAGWLGWASLLWLLRSAVQDEYRPMPRWVQIGTAAGLFTLLVVMLLFASSAEAKGSSHLVSSLLSFPSVLGVPPLLLTLLSLAKYVGIEKPPCAWPFHRGGVVRPGEAHEHRHRQG